MGRAKKMMMLKKKEEKNVKKNKTKNTTHNVVAPKSPLQKSSRRPPEGSGQNDAASTNHATPSTQSPKPTKTQKSPAPSPQSPESEVIKLTIGDEDLADHIRHRRWRRASGLLRTSPLRAKLAADLKPPLWCPGLPLHLACETRPLPPVWFVRNLLDAFPGAAGVGEGTWGLTPLHFAADCRRLDAAEFGGLLYKGCGCELNCTISRGLLDSESSWSDDEEEESMYTSSEVDTAVALKGGYGDDSPRIEGPLVEWPVTPPTLNSKGNGKKKKRHSGMHTPKSFSLVDSSPMSPLDGSVGAPRAPRSFLTRENTDDVKPGVYDEDDESYLGVSRESRQVRIVRLLLTACPEAISMRDKFQGHTPAHIVASTARFSQSGPDGWCDRHRVSRSSWQVFELVFSPSSSSNSGAVVEATDMWGEDPVEIGRRTELWHHFGEVGISTLSKPLFDVDVDDSAKPLSECTADDVSKVVGDPNCDLKSQGSEPEKSLSDNTTSELNIATHIPSDLTSSAGNVKVDESTSSEDKPTAQVSSEDIHYKSVKNELFSVEESEIQSSLSPTSVASFLPCLPEAAAMTDTPLAQKAISKGGERKETDSFNHAVIVEGDDEDSPRCEVKNVSSSRSLGSDSFLPGNTSEVCDTADNHKKIVLMLRLRSSVARSSQRRIVEKMLGRRDQTTTPKPNQPNQFFEVALKTARPKLIRNTNKSDEPLEINWNTIYRSYPAITTRKGGSNDEAEWEEAEIDLYIPPNSTRDPHVRISVYESNPGGYGNGRRRRRRPRRGGLGPLIGSLESSLGTLVEDFPTTHSEDKDTHPYPLVRDGIRLGLLWITSISMKSDVE